MKIKHKYSSVQGHKTFVTSNMKKTKFRIHSNVLEMINDEGKETCLFITLTFPDKPTLKTAARRFNSANTNALRHEMVKGYRVLEPHKDLAPHYHLIIATGVDVRQGFDFESYLEAKNLHWKSRRAILLTKKYGKSANPELRRYWNFFRTFKRFGFGRTEAIPIRSEAEAAAEYVSKYLANTERPIEYKGKRLHYPLKWKPSTSSQFM